MDCIWKLSKRSGLFAFPNERFPLSWDNWVWWASGDPIGRHLNKENVITTEFTKVRKEYDAMVEGSMSWDVMAITLVEYQRPSTGIRNRGKNDWNAAACVMG